MSSEEVFEKVKGIIVDQLQVAESAVTGLRLTKMVL